MMQLSSGGTVRNVTGRKKFIAVAEKKVFRISQKNNLNL
jgi:hypothetical protein